jgi:hypothetical protein
MWRIHIKKISLQIPSGTKNNFSCSPQILFHLCLVGSEEEEEEERIFCVRRDVETQQNSSGRIRREEEGTMFCLVHRSDSNRFVLSVFSEQ